MRRREYLMVLKLNSADMNSKSGHNISTTNGAAFTAIQFMHRCALRERERETRAESFGLYGMLNVYDWHERHNRLLSTQFLLCMWWDVGSVRIHCIHNRTILLHKRNCTERECECMFVCCVSKASAKCLHKFYPSFQPRANTFTRSHKYIAQNIRCQCIKQVHL